MSSNWTIELSEGARRQLSRLDHAVAKRITRFLVERVGTLHDPRQLGKPMVGDLKQFWTYRVGDYRLLCELKDSRLTVTVVKIDHRSQVYR